MTAPDTDMVRATEAEKALAADIWQRFHAQKYEQAQVLLAQALETSDHPRFKRIQARFCLFEGRERDAETIIRDILPKIWAPGSWELALAGIGACRARVLKDQKILYFPLRKCGSTSLLNMMKIIAGEDVRGEHVHQEDHSRRSVNLAAMVADFPGYFTCTAVRDPIERLLSFYRGNIAGRDHLMAEYDGLKEFYGLPTKPDLDYFLANFTRYRQVFISVRDHTEPLTASIGSNLDVFDWIGGMAQLPDLSAKLSARAGIELPLLQDMVTAGKTKPGDVNIPEAVRALYAADYEAYSAFF